MNIVPSVELETLLPAFGASVLYFQIQWCMLKTNTVIHFLLYVIIQMENSFSKGSQVLSMIAEENVVENSNR